MKMRIKVFLLALTAVFCAENRVFPQTLTHSFDTIPEVHLSTVYITPDNMPAADYILKKVWEKADENRKLLTSYAVTPKSTLIIKDAPLLAEAMEVLLSPIQRGVVNTLLSLAGIKKLFNLFVKYPKLDFTASARCTYSGGKFRQGKVQISSPTVTEDEKKTLAKVLTVEDPFEQNYGKNCKWSRKNAKKNHFEYEGSYEEKGMEVSRLKYYDAKHKITHRLYIVEDEWGILRYEKRDSVNHFIRECAKVKGVYLPVSSRARIRFNLYDDKVIKDFSEKKQKKYKEHFKDGIAIELIQNSVTVYE